MRWQKYTIVGCCLAALFLLQPLLHGQRRGGPQPSNLSPATNAALTRLAQLSQFPAPAWRYNLGDLPHGEDPSLDDSSWPLAAGRRDYPANAVWFRATIQIPAAGHGYDLTGSRVLFSFRVQSSDDLQEIVYFDGRRVAMGRGLEPVDLFENARPGDKVLVAVKVLPTAQVKHFSGSTEEVQYSSSRPNPQEIHDEAVSAAYLLPAVESDPLASIQKVEAAVKSIDFSTLDSGNQAAFDSSLQQAQSQLMELRPELQKANIHLSGQSHIDAAWLWPWTETVEVVRQTFATALQLMGEYPNYTYSQSAAQYYEWIQQKYPVEFQRIQQAVKEGRWEIVGGMWVEPDFNMPDGESQVRQILVAKRYFEKNFGVDVRIGWNPDSFGFDWQLPQIYKRSGIDYFMTTKLNGNDTNKLPLKLFWWQSPDGSRVLTIFPNGLGGTIEPVGMASEFAQTAKLNPGTSEILHIYGIGDHGGGPTRAMLDTGDSWLEPNKAYASANFGVTQSYLSTVESKLDTAHSPVWSYKTLAAGDTTIPKPPPGEIGIPTWNDELYFEYHRGTYTTQADQKNNMRTSEEEMLNAEKWSSLAWLSGTPYPGDELNEAWKKVLFNQFHDLAAGSGIGPIYRDAEKDYQLVKLASGAASNTALHAIASYVDTAGTAGETPIVVFNPLAWTRTDLAEFDVQLPAAASNIEIVSKAGKVVNSQATVQDAATHTYHVTALVPDVPSLGYEIVYARPATAKPPVADGVKVSDGGMTLENQYLRVKVDAKTGCITSLVNKATNFDAIASGGCGNQLQAFHDHPRSSDAWNIDADYVQYPDDLGPATSVQPIESGPFRAAIRVTHATEKSKFSQEIILYAGVDHVEIANDIDWHEQHVLLKAAFPLAASSPEATYEIPYGTIERPTTRNNSVEQAKFEVSAIRWADLGDGKNGFSLINENKYGYDDKGNVLRLTLLRAPTDPDPNADQGEHRFSYALYPHAGDWKQALTMRQGFDYNYRLEAMQIPSHSGALPASYSFVKTEPDNVVVTAMKKTEDGDGLVVRFFEWSGKESNVTLTLPPGIVSATLSNLMEKPLGGDLPVANRREVTVPVTPYEIQTVIVHYPAPSKNFLAGLGRP
jgi:alpha-mannosidase